MANYAKLKKLQSYRTRGYDFRKGIWVIIKDEDVEYFMSTGRVEFAPKGIIPKNDATVENPDGVISIDGHGKDGIIVSKKEEPEEVNDELREEENAKVLEIREKYKRKREQKIKEEAEKNKVEEEEKKKKKEQKKADKEKTDKVQDVTNPKYIQEKNRLKGL